ncbi:MAG: transcriptional repressor NrdR [Phycisphaerales bacterium]|jgi:transcriptional repressor NrdR|nr:transcriptional repressor NrdR [Phycisphaerales bacterium]MEA2736424.1 transcriptional repressor NrdR [Humisphaera sp.]
MHCPFCNADKESLKVIDSRTCEGGRSIRRRRECLHCQKRFTTYERIEDPIKLIVVKKDGRRVPWDRAKILTGLERACFKRPVPESELLRIVDEVEEEVFKTHDREVASTLVGSLVTDKLRRVDQVAYVRFASVYRQFKTLEELMDEARAVLDAKRFEDPTQGVLFVEPAGTTTPAPPGASNGVNGNKNHAAEATPPTTKKRRAKGTPESATAQTDA